MERVTTGIPGLDSMTEGGFKPNSNILVTGGVGTGKSTFCMQYLIEGASNGQKGIYVTFEEETHTLKDNMSRYNWNIDALEEKKLIRIIHLAPKDVMQVVKSGYGEIINLVKDLDATRVVIDSVSSIELMIEDDFRKRESMLHLMTWLRKNGCTSLLVSEAEQHPSKYSRHGIVEFIVDGVIVLYNLRRQMVRQRALEILKMRGTNHMSRIVPFIISNGIELLPRQKLFGDF